mmetsp:Transcript_17752/g.50296  ORF Transcript_17752/g.50296 Transcript_17752/m.50296 type:complete len:122 (+) Transcript_17752:1060-1425(+)
MVYIIVINGRPILATSILQFICICIARSCAYFMCPALVMVYFSKLRATTSFLARTPVSMFLQGDSHELHLYCGYTILFFSVCHTQAHLTRWADQGNLHICSLIISRASRDSSSSSSSRAAS